MTEINNITKLEININKIEQMRHIFNKSESANMKVIGEVLEPIIEALNQARNAIVEEQIDKARIQKKLDALLEYEACKIGIVNHDKN